MEELKTFLLANWQIIASILLFVVATVIALIRGTKKGLSVSDILLGFVLDQVPTWINLAEEGKGTGEEKRVRVLNNALTLASKELGRQLTEQESSLIVSHVSAKIEEILSTPQKKESQKKSKYR